MCAIKVNLKRQQLAAQFATTGSLTRNLWTCIGTHYSRVVQKAVALWVEKSVN